MSQEFDFYKIFSRQVLDGYPVILQRHEDQYSQGIPDYSFVAPQPYGDFNGWIEVKRDTQRGRSPYTTFKFRPSQERWIKKRRQSPSIYLLGVIFDKNILESEWFLVQAGNLFIPNDKTWAQMDWETFEKLNLIENNIISSGKLSLSKMGFEIFNILCPKTSSIYTQPMD